MKGIIVVNEVYEGNLTTLGCEVTATMLNMNFSHIGTVDSKDLTYVIEKKRFNEVYETGLLLKGVKFGLVVSKSSKFKVGDILTTYRESCVLELLDKIQDTPKRKERVARSNTKVSIADLSRFIYKKSNGYAYDNTNITKDMLDDDLTIEILSQDKVKVKNCHGVGYFNVLICEFDKDMNLIHTEVYAGDTAYMQKDCFNTYIGDVIDGKLILIKD